jgi:hypothetical protein
MMIKKYKLTAIGLVFGAFAGYLYFHFAGCANGKCIITSSPTFTTLYGGMLGILFMNVFKKRENKSDQ